jgi:hypothetical protein
MLENGPARVRNAARGVAVPGVSLGHTNLTPREREVVQDWMARRYLQLHDKRVGRRRTDLPLPASVKSSSQVDRFLKFLRQVKP